MTTKSAHQPLPVILWTRPRCSKCSSTKLRKRRTMKRHDNWTDAIRQYVTCDNCGKKFVLVGE